MSSNNLPQTEESGLQPLTQSIPQSRSTQHFSEDQVYNVGPSLSLPLPAVLRHHYDHPETTKDEFEDSSEPDQSVRSQKDDFHTEMLAQVPFELGQPSLAGFPDMPQIQEEGMKNVKEKEDVVEKDATLADVLEEPSRNVEEDKTGSCFQMSEEAKQPPPSKEVNNATKDVEKLNLSEGIQHPLEEGIQEQKELVSLGRVNTTKTIEVESTKMDDEETDGLEASCLFPSHLGPTRPDKEPQSLVLHLESDKPATMQHQQKEELDLDTSMLASVHPEDPKLDNQTITMCIPEHTTSKPEKPELISISGTSPTAFDLQSSTVNSSAEDYLTFEGDEPSTAPYQTCKDPETQQTLPRPGTEQSQISKDQTGVSLNTCVMVSATFFSAVICLAVGIQEPSVFLCVGLFLLSLWF